MNEGINENASYKGKDHKHHLVKDDEFLLALLSVLGFDVPEHASPTRLQ